MANAYRDMMGMFAWKHLKDIIEQIKIESNKPVDSMPIENLTVAQVAEARGIRKAFDKMQNEIEFILGEGGYAERDGT